MSMSEELSGLHELHQRGVLSDEEYSRAKERTLGGKPRTGDGAAMDAINGLRRSREDRWLGGVCGGLARITGVASWVWRIMFVALLACAGTGALIYLLMWIFVPQE